MFVCPRCFSTFSTAQERCGIDGGFALKVPFGDLAANKNLAARSKREAEAASWMSHSGIVTVFDLAGATAVALLAWHPLADPEVPAAAALATSPSGVTARF